MYDDIKEARQELIDTLLAICVASMRLAIKLEQTQKRKGGKENAPGNRYDHHSQYAENRSRFELCSQTSHAMAIHPR